MTDAILAADEARTKAAGSSFYAGMRLLPKAEREAMFAIYAFSRTVDDIADEGTASRGARAAELDAWRDEIERLYAGKPSPRAALLAGAVHQFGLRKEDFLSIIDGMAMDVAEDIRAPDLATLDLYCDRVASAVGRLSIKIFGMDEDPGFRLAHHLGRAVQLTNILRDIDRDADAGRLYLPREFLSEAEISDYDPRASVDNASVDRACRKVSAMARDHFDKAYEILRARPRGLLRAARLMAAVYAEILSEMIRTGWAPPRRQIRIGRGQLVLIVLRTLVAG